MPSHCARLKGLESQPQRKARKLFYTMISILRISIGDYLAGEEHGYETPGWSTQR